jgi:DNA repair exonuclease SbcCD nuclease subunit
VGAEGGLHIALFHGAELGSRPAGKSMHGPFRAEGIRRQGFALALCGHYHRRRLDASAGLVYPGSPEPLTFDEEGERGPVLVEVDPGGSIRLSALALNRWHAVQAECDVDGAATSADVLDRVRHGAVAALDGLPADRSMLRLTLRGEVPDEAGVDAAVVETAVVDVTGAAVVRLRDLTRTAIDPEASASDPTARGEFIRAMLASRERAQGDAAELEVVDDALRYGLQALAGVEVCLR